MILQEFFQAMLLKSKSPQNELLRTNLGKDEIGLII